VTAPDAIVEARGLLCPVPIIRLARAAAALPPGALIELLTDDPAAEYDVPAWCRLRGHELVCSEPLGERTPTASGVPEGPEPHTPNENPGQAVRHLIRLGSPGSR
jgi:tRNA 2-thiouridine synthesizing protein A